MHLGKEFRRLDIPMVVSTLVSETLRIDMVYPGCMVMVQKHELPTDLFPLEMCDFDLILGMDWLSKHNAVINCLISMMAAKRYLQKRYSAYLVYVTNKNILEARLETIHVVKEFPDIFLEELTSLPPDRELEFTIDLIPISAHISQAPYRMAPSELKELKVQLQDLVDKGFIRPSASQ